jgi:NADP-dependent 3-hydroxy acid dehydrogenase YdfG
MPRPRRIADQVIAITGASSGVGRAIAVACGEQGAKVAVMARSLEALEACAAEIRARGGQALPLVVDVADAGAVESAAAQIEARWGRIDTWINNAMVSVFSPALKMSPEEFRRVTEVNYLGAVYGTLAALRRMVANDRGTVIQIGSALVYRSIPLQSAYCASKAAMRGFTDSLRSELYHDGSDVKLCMLQLPAVNTPQFDVVRSRLPGRPQPVPPIYQPEVIASAALYVAAHQNRELWIGGSTFKAIVGQFVIPGLLDRYLGRIGYRAQQTRQRESAFRRDNVFTPLPGDRGAHGRFDAIARRRSFELWARTHPLLLLATAGVALWLSWRTACFVAR